ncbi:hypothetical protein [Metabacillus halosaccharovorans]|uniref:hypothetical protein n=1 Tax=Metabacillus halosaccharovorans TaxID=930124 RepID=UPI00099519BF|nr:hypothetical protein [Metabacillus halosaccharovorans]
MSKLNSKVIIPQPSEQIDLKRIGRVLHLPYNPAGQMSTQSLELKKLGVSSSFCNYYESKFKYPIDIPSPISNIPVNQRKKYMHAFAKKKINYYNIFHFHGGQSFTSAFYTDLPLLKKMGKKMIMSYWGSEVRRFSIAKQKNPFAIVKLYNEDLITSRLANVSQYIDTVIVPDHELLEYVYGYFKKIYIVRASVEGSNFQPLYPSERNTRPLIVHAPSDRRIKGTEFILKAIDNLKTKVDFDFKLIENMSNAEVVNWYKKADIVVDQLRLGIYGTVSIESMLMGKPVISYVRDDLKQKYPSGLPVISASPHTIEKELYDLIKNPKLRYELGVKGRIYAENNHLPEKIARQLITVYNSL